MTALTVYLANAASSTLTTADQLYITSGSPATTQTYTTIGNNVTGFGEICSQGAASGWAAGGSIGSPTGKGFLWDVTTLEGQQFISGNWTPSIRLNAAQGSGAPQAGTLTGDIYMRAYKRSSGGTYTQIASCSLTGQTVNSTFTTYTLNAASGSATTFSTGDKLYLDVWFNCTANTNANALQGIRLNRLSTDTTGFTGDTNSQFVTPGYQSSTTNNSMSSTDLLTAADSLLVAESALATEALTATESLLCTDGDLATDALTISDVPALQSWPVDALSVTDSGLYTDTDLRSSTLTETDTLLIGETYQPIDANTASDLQSALQSWPIDALSSSDALLVTDALADMEPLTINESVLAIDTVLSLDALSSSDSFLTGSINNNVMAFEDDLLATDSLLIVISGVLADTLAVSDLFATGSVNTNDMASEDDLMIADTVLSVIAASLLESTTASDQLLVGHASSVQDTLNVIESLAGQQTYVPLEVNSASDALVTGGSYVVLESRVVSDVLATGGSFVPLDGLSIAESLLAAASVLWSDLLSASDTFTRDETNSNPMDSIDILLASDAFAILDLVAFVEIDAATDTAFLASVPRSNILVYVRKGTAFVEVRG